ncbi:MAG: secretion system X translation initiation factor [Steroidobacteraceae bacterium]
MKLLNGPAAKSGSRKALLMLAAGGAVTALLWALADPPATEAVAVVEQAAARGEGPKQAQQFAFVPRKVASIVTNLFGGHSWYVAPPPPPPAEPSPPPPPSAPPLPFRMLGSYASSGAAPVYFLVKGDSVYDVRIGDVIDGIYSVDSVKDGQLNFTYLPLKIGQSLPVGNTP